MDQQSEIDDFSSPGRIAFPHPARRAKAKHPAAAARLEADPVSIDVPPVERVSGCDFIATLAASPSRSPKYQERKLLDVDRNTRKMLGARIRNHSAALNTEPNFSRSAPLLFSDWPSSRPYGLLLGYFSTCVKKETAFEDVSDYGVRKSRRSRTSRRYSGAWPSGSRTSNHPHGNFADRAKDLFITTGRYGASQASGDRRSNIEDD